MDNAGLIYIINRYITGFRVFGPQVPPSLRSFFGFGVEGLGFRVASLRSFFGSFLPSKEAPTEGSSPKQHGPSHCRLHSG